MATRKAAKPAAKPLPFETLTPELVAEIGRTDLLLSYQQGAIREIETHKVTVVEKSRRIGLTWGLAAGAVLWSAAARAAGGMDTLYIGYSADMAREFIDAAADWARLFDQAATAVEESLFDDGGPDRQIKAFGISFGSGFEIKALSSRPRSLRGKQGAVIIDEAAFVDDLKKIIKAAMALLMWGGRVIICSTHNGVQNPFNEAILDVLKGRRPWHRIRITLDDAIAAGLYRRICLVTRQEWTEAGEAAWRADLLATYGEAADEELLCVPHDGGGRYFPRVLIESRMVSPAPVLRWTAPRGWVDVPDHVRQAEAAAWCERTLAPALQALPKGKAAIGVDFGLVADISVIWLLVTGPDLVRRTGLVVELGRMPYRQQEQVLFFLIEHLPTLLDGIALDATGNGAILAQVTRQHRLVGALRVIEVAMSAKWYAEAFPPVKADLEDGTLELPRDEPVRTDLEIVEIRNGQPTIPEKRAAAADGTTRHGDSAVALVLARQASRTDAPHVESWPVGTHRAGFGAFGGGDGTGGAWGMARGVLGRLKGWMR